MDTIQTWFDRKKNGQIASIRETVRVTEEWKRSTGRMHYAQVSLTAYSSQSFEFSSAVGAWPSEESRMEFESYVLDGVVSELLASPAPPVLGIRVVVESVSVHEEHSNGNAFYQAARCATSKLLEGETGLYRGNCS